MSSVTDLFDKLNELDSGIQALETVTSLFGQADKKVVIDPENLYHLLTTINDKLRGRYAELEQVARTIKT